MAATSEEVSRSRHDKKNLPDKSAGATSSTRGKDLADDSTDSASGPTKRPADMLMDGCPVVLTGLVARPEWNGKRAKVVRFLPEVQKYEIKLLDVDVNVKARPENVEINVKETKKLHRKGSDEKGGWHCLKESTVQAVRQYISENETTWTKSLMKEEVAERLGIANDSQMAALVDMALGELGLKKKPGVTSSADGKAFSPKISPAERPVQVYSPEVSPPKQRQDVSPPKGSRRWFL